MTDELRLSTFPCIGPLEQTIKQKPRFIMDLKDYIRSVSDFPQTGHYVSRHYTDAEVGCRP